MTKTQQNGLFVLIGAAQGMSNPATIDYVLEDGSGRVYGRALGAAWDSLKEDHRAKILETLGSVAREMMGLKP